MIRQNSGSRWRPTLLVVLYLALSCLGSSASERRLFILHTNDIHGHIEAYDGGGLERIAWLIEEYRNRYPGQVVLLDAGDTSLGTPLSGVFHGQPTAEIMDLLDYDAVAVGNHEFNWGKEKMRELTDRIDAPALCANLVTLDGSPSPFPPFTVIQRNGVRLGIIGLVTPDTYRRAPAHATEGWQFLPPARAARSALATLPEVDAVISLNHLGLEGDRGLARAVPSLDLIVGGHSHTVLQEVAYEGDTPIVQAGSYGRYLGVLEVEVDTQSDRVHIVSYRLVPALDAAGVNVDAHSVVEKYAAALRPILMREVATVDGVIRKGARPGSYDTPLGNLISDVFRHQADTDTALYNRGGVRFDMEAGPLTVETVHKLFPFDDPVVVLEATGEQLRAVIEQGTVDGEGPLSASGLTARVVDGKVTDIEVQGEPLRREKIYTVATTAFLAGGGDGMATLASLPRLRTLDYTRDVLLRYLETAPRLSPPPGERLRNG